MSESDDELPVTIVITRTVKSGREKDYETFLSGIAKVAATYPGHLGINIMRPHDGGREYTLVFRFDRVKNLRRWEESTERAEWLAKLPELVEGNEQVQKLTGMEAWFVIPGKTVKAPPRYKMAAVTFLAIFPIVQGMNAFVVPELAFLPPLVRGLVVSVMMIVLMTYVVMPRLTRWMSFWLYPKTSA